MSELKYPASFYGVVSALNDLIQAILAGGDMGHVQNTDTGTTNVSFQIDSDAAGPLLKNVASALELRNATDTGYANAVVGSATINALTSLLGNLRIVKGATHAEIAPPSSIPASYTLTLPGGLPGSVQGLTVDAAGTMGYASIAGGHTQNTDTGTTNTTFQIDSDASGPLLKNVSGVLEVRNAGDSAYANTVTGNLSVKGTATVIESTLTELLGNLRIVKGATYAEIAAPASIPTSYTLTVPTGLPGSLQALMVSAAGSMSYASLPSTHTQNTDTGTTSSTFQLDNDASGPLLKNVSGALEIRSAADSAYANTSVNNASLFGNLRIFKGANYAEIAPPSSIPSSYTLTVPSGLPGSLQALMVDSGGLMSYSSLPVTHTQNTDTGTTSSTFQLDNDASGPLLKNVSGRVELRNAGDSTYADLTVRDLTVKTTVTPVAGQFLKAANTNGDTQWGNLPAATVGYQLPYTGNTGTGLGYYDDPILGRMVYLTLDAFRTIGNTGSSSNITGTWLQTLFEFLWAQYDDTECPLLTSAGVGTSRGASANADWVANRRLTLPDDRGRVMLNAGSGSGLTARTKGVKGGSETHNQIPRVDPAVTFLNNRGGVTLDHVVTFVGSGGNCRFDAVFSNLLDAGIDHMPPFRVTHQVISSGHRA
jgi:hypothetical protein